MTLMELFENTDSVDVSDSKLFENTDHLFEAVMCSGFQRKLKGPSYCAEGVISVHNLFILKSAAIPGLGLYVAMTFDDGGDQIVLHFVDSRHSDSRIPVQHRSEHKLVEQHCVGRVLGFGNTSCTEPQPLTEGLLFELESN